MFKLGLFVCVVFILVRNGNTSTSEDEFGSFWGPCPAPPLKPFSYLYLNDLIGKWYTHLVLGQYTPWKYLECETDSISYNGINSDNLTSKFVVPGIQLPVEWNGVILPVARNSGKFEFNYFLDGWLLSKRTEVLQYYSRGAALVWNCFDFWFFHIESISVMTKYQDPNDWRISPSVFWSMNQTLENSGISPSWFERIVQKNCN